MGDKRFFLMIAVGLVIAVALSWVAVTFLLPA
jgi:hypothetical protein